MERDREIGLCGVCLDALNETLEDDGAIDLAA